MSARSAQRTRWRRWRMGWDIAGRKDRDGRRMDTSRRAAQSSPWPRGSSSSSFYICTLFTSIFCVHLGLSDLGVGAAPKSVHKFIMRTHVCAFEECQEFT